MGQRGPALAADTAARLRFTRGAITSKQAAAIAVAGGAEVTLDGVDVKGAEAALSGGNGLILKASKKTRFVALSGDGIEVTSNADITLNDAAIEASGKALHGTVNDKLKATAGARMIGKRGGLETSSNFELAGTGATIDGGDGPGIMASVNAQITFRNGRLNGMPAIRLEQKATRLDLQGTQVMGAQTIGQ